MLEEQCIVGTRKGLENCHQLHVITCQHVIPKLYYLLSFLWNIKEDFEKYLSALVVHNGNAMQWCLAPNFLQNMFFCSL